MKKLLIFTGAIIMFQACGKDNASEPEKITDPTAVNLLFPIENSLCNVGTDSTETESDVIFEWSAAENTDQYELNLKNLNTGDSISQLTSDLKITLRILRSTPFAWYVVSKSATREKTAKSETWKFYNAGEAIQNYAPFPAEIVAPKMAEVIGITGNTITLSWIGSDIDGDITGYDVYFGTTSPPGLIETNLQTNSLNVDISANTVYYWKVISKDAQGNSSDSGVYQFKVAQ